MLMRDLFDLPKDLPVPQDDGACDHLVGMTLPKIKLTSTDGRSVDLFSESLEPTVLFFYPRTGEPSKPAPADWDSIPGARGCTPQSCGFRDIYSEFQQNGFKVFGASTQSSEYQKEFALRNHIPFEILSDEQFALTRHLNLPTFTYDGMKLVKRLALVLNHGRIEKVFYPVFPPNKNAETVLYWIKGKK
jgi:peroxiredoxin